MSGIIVIFALTFFYIQPTLSVDQELRDSVLKVYCKNHRSKECDEFAARNTSQKTVSEQVKRYCVALSMTYHVRCLHDTKSTDNGLTTIAVPGGPGQRSLRRRRRRQVRDLYALGYSKKQLEIICSGYREIFKTNCSSNADEPGKMKKYCDMYRAYCTQYDIAYEKEMEKMKVLNNNFAIDHPSYPFWIAMLKAKKYPDGHFCTEYPRTCPIELRGTDIMTLCNTFQFTRDEICPNYERAEDRIGCNRYRFHCMHNAPPYDNFDGAEL